MWVSHPLHLSFLRVQVIVLFLYVPNTQKCLHMQLAHKHLINITKRTSEYIHCKMVMGPVILKNLVLKKTFS